MLRELNVKMVILSDEQKAIHHISIVNEFVSCWDNICTSILH